MQQNPSVFLFQAIPALFIKGVFYFFLIRPQQKQQKKQHEVINNLKKNDEVVTFGGIHGTIINIKEKTFIVRVDDNTKIEFDKSAIAYVKKQRE